jgi:hypothetical protein
MEDNQPNPIERHGNLMNAFLIEYLMLQYPWFTRDQLLEAMEREEYKMRKIMSSLDAESGSRPEMFGF